MALRGRDGDIERFGGFLQREAGEVAQLDESGLGRIFSLELFEGLVEGQEVLGRVVVLGGEQGAGFEFDLPPVAAALLTLTPAGPVDEDPAHSLRGRREEVPPAVPALDLLRVHQPHLRFMHQRRRLAARGLPASTADRMRVTSFIPARRSETGCGEYTG